MTDDERVLAFWHGLLQGSQNDRNRAAADAEYVRKHGPIKRIALRVGDKVTVYEVSKKPKRKR